MSIHQISLSLCDTSLCVSPKFRKLSYYFILNDPKAVTEIINESVFTETETALSLVPTGLTDFNTKRLSQGQRAGGCYSQTCSVYHATT